MRIAVLIIGLVLMFVIGVQSCSVTVGGEVVTGLSETEEEREEGEDLSAGGGAGIVVALLYLLGSALVFAKAKLSMWLFIVAAAVAFIGATTGFTDLVVWGVVALGLAGMCYMAARKDREPRATRVPLPCHKSSQRAENSRRSSLRSRWSSAAAGTTGARPPR